MTRIEHDLLGEREIPGDAYWGIHTLRAIENFTISKSKVSVDLISAIVMVKKACALTNSELGYLEQKIAEAIVIACDDIISGKLSDQFPTDALQGGAGTSTNMNVNEVLANRALEIMEFNKGEYTHCHPIEHVNMHQSTNDVYPTALKIAAIIGVRNLSNAAATLQGAFQIKEKEFVSIVTIGRTELQDAVPMTLGAQFASFADAIARDRWRAFKCEERLRVVNIGGTAIGTGLTAPRKYIFRVIERLREITGCGLTRGENVVDQTANADAFVEVSGILSAHASNLIKVANDLRLLHMMNEIALAPAQAGSSIMPGKVNPVIPEAAIQVGMKVQGNHAIIADCGSRGSLQINEFLPLLGYCLLESISILTNANIMLARCVEKIQSRGEICLQHANESVTLITALLPEIGYEKAQSIVKDFAESGSKNFRGYLAETLGEEMVNRYLTPSAIMALGFAEKKNKKSD